MKYQCQSCQTTYLKWIGKCTNCDEWNSLITIEDEKKAKLNFNAFPVQFESIGEESEIQFTQKLETKLQEFNKTIGGGLVPGGVILLSGDPGIGKSTLLLQISDSNFDNKDIFYISGEESISQIKLRANRIGIKNKNLKISASNVLEEILGLCQEHKKNTALVIIDSIQTIFSSTLEGTAGSVGQIKFCAQKLIEFAKKEGVSLIIVGHVTKDGNIAGPKILEHSVDTVLHFEGEKNYIFRILRSIKNRFGATDEIGIFEIKESGLQEVANPSLVFLSQQKEGATGSIIFPNFEGTRPIMIEIQSLVSSSFLQMPRRAVIGWDHNRLPMICAVLEKHCKITLANKDVYLTVMSGLKINEPAADLAVLIAILSSYFDIIIPINLIAFGEIGLSGEVRTVQHSLKRIEEAKKLNCKGVVCAKNSEKIDGVIYCNDVFEVVKWVKSLAKKKESI